MFQGLSSQKPQILFNINGLAIWYGFPDITRINYSLSQ